jgi:DnaJ-class molecular chaperone
VVVLAALAWLALSVAAAYWYPYHDCRWCKGTGWFRSPVNRRNKRKCKACKGDGDKLRFWARYMHGRR